MRTKTTCGGQYSQYSDMADKKTERFVFLQEEECKDDRSVGDEIKDITNRRCYRIR